LGISHQDPLLSGGLVAGFGLLAHLAPAVAIDALGFAARRVGLRLQRVDGIVLLVSVFRETPLPAAKSAGSRSCRW